MKARGLFISTLLVIDTFLASFAVGFNSRHVLVVDPSLKEVVAPPAVSKQGNQPPDKNTAAGGKKAGPEPARQTKLKPVPQTRAAGKPAGKSQTANKTANTTVRKNNKKLPAKKRAGSKAGA